MLSPTEADQKDDYYKTLGVPRNASQKEIKKAYYEVSRGNFAKFNNLRFFYIFSNMVVRAVASAGPQN